MLIKTLEVGHLAVNCYIVTHEDTLDCAVIDPGDESGAILDYIESNNLKVQAIFITHGHFDHVGAVDEVHEQTGAPIWINELEVTKKGEPYTQYKLPQRDGMKYYGEGDMIRVGGLAFEIMETPGHSPGGVVIRCGDALFTGDTLFKESCGRTDLDGGDMSQMMASLKRLSELEGDLEVYPGHMEHSTLDRERRFNYYMKYANGEY